MTSPRFNASRAIDLSGLAAAAKQPPPPAGSSFVIELDEQNFEPVMALSMRHPIVVEMYSPRANAAELSQTLTQLANAAGGRYLLARANVDAAPGIAQAFGIQAVPTVIGVIGGQLAPLFQGTKPKEEVVPVIEALLQAATANGIVGRADPVAGGPGENPDLPDPRFAAADEALESGDFAAAVAEFDKILAHTPNDAEAVAGRAQASLLVRLHGVDPPSVLAAATADPDDLDAHLAAADLEIASGRIELAFKRLIDLIRRSSGANRDTVRVRLLELFETVGKTDPAVLNARRDLMSALF
ncbi:MAG: tetratricopeptide repeat protein [Micropruina sp.]